MTTTWYSYITPMGEPSDTGLDGRKRATVSFSVLCFKRKSDDVLSEIAQVLVDAGVGALNVTIFGSTKNEVPDGDGPYIEVIETGGPGPQATQQDRTAYQRPTVQLFTRAKTFEAAMAKAKEAYAALAAVKNTEITVP